MTSRRLLVHATDQQTRSGKAGITPESSGIRAAYLRAGSPEAAEIRLSKGVPGRWAAGSFAELDAARMPGVYEFGVPDEMLAAGATRVLLLFTLPGAWVDPIEVDLVAYDPSDPFSIGLTELQDDSRHEFLRQALPRMTEMELALGYEGAVALSQVMGAEDPAAPWDGLVEGQRPNPP